MRIRGRSRGIALPLLSALGLAIAVGGCGGSEGSSSSQASSTATATGGASAQTQATTTQPTTGHTTAHAAGVGASTVATVNGVPITHSELAHWLTVTAALSRTAHGASTSAVRDKALGFLITQQWVLDEAAAKGISVSEAEVHEHLTEVESKQFKKSGELQRYLAKAHETEADLNGRVRLELLEQKISKQATAAKHTSAEKQAALASLQNTFEKKWKALTKCQSGYGMEDCGAS